MKKLEELGISPTPWKIGRCSDGWNIVRDAKGKYAATPDGDEETEAISNARLIAAAPEMYAALWDLCFGESTTVNCAKCGGNDHGDGIEHCSKTCSFYKCRAALAKASKETEERND